MKNTTTPKGFTKTIFVAVAMLLLTAIMAVIVRNNNHARLPFKNSAQSTGDEHASATASMNRYLQAASLLQVGENEYDIRYSGKKGKYQSPNKANDLQALYEPGIWELQSQHNRFGKSSKLTLINSGIYADGKCIAKPQGSAIIAGRKNNLDFNHRNFTEQYINSEQGVRQNFIVNEVPRGSKELCVALRFEGMRAEKYNNDILFAEGSQQWLYSGLKVWDATGKVLDAEMQLTGDTIKLLAKVEGANFPVTIDPIIGKMGMQDASTTIAGTSASQYLGRSVAGAGDVNGDGYSDVIIGASGKTGAAYVHYGTSSGINAQGVKLTDGKLINFGASVAGAGDVNGDGYSDVMIGAYIGGTESYGVALIYLGSAQGINTRYAQMIKGDAKGDQFGSSLSGAGDVNGDGYSDVVIGAPGLDFNKGAFYVFFGGSGDMTLHKRIGGNNENGYLGYSAAGAGDVNADGFSDIAIVQNKPSAVYVYYGSASGIASARRASITSGLESSAGNKNVTAAGDVNGDGYGDILVGVPGYSNGQFNEGACMLYTGSSNGIKPVPAVIKESNIPYTALGTSVSYAGDVNDDGYGDIMMGGTTKARPFWFGRRGIVYVAGGPSLSNIAQIQINNRNDYFGKAVSGAGDVDGDGYSDIIIGAEGYSNGFANAGAAFVYHGAASGVSYAYQTLQGTDEEWLGEKVVHAGDVNGDGYGDVLVAGAIVDDLNSTYGSFAGLYYGTSTGVNPNFVKLFSAVSREGGGIGPSATVSDAGDVNGDGFADIIVGSGNSLYMHHGSATGISRTPNRTLSGNISALSAAGDVNGDGFADIVTGQWGYINGGWKSYIAVYPGSSTGIRPTLIAAKTENEVPQGFGSISGVGDVNGDGYADIAVANSSYDNGQTNEGAVFIYYGNGAGLSPDALTIVESNQAGAYFGKSVSAAGDVNGDGFADVVIGTNAYNNATTGNGAAFVYYGSRSGIQPANPKIIGAVDRGTGFGGQVSGAGDVNGDGYADIAVTAPYYSDEEYGIFGYWGQVFIFKGGKNGVSKNDSIVLLGRDYPDQLSFGSSLSGGKDINGDGLGDIVVGTPGDYIADFWGEARIFYSRSSRVAANLALYNTGTTTDIQQSNISNSRFSIGMFYKNPQGRLKGKLVWEAKKQGQAFSSNAALANSTQLTGQAAYTRPALTGTRLNAFVNKAGFATKIRVRIKYDPVTSLNGQVYGPWVYPQGYFTVPGMNATPLYVPGLNLVAVKPIWSNINIKLNWQTGLENINTYFSIERSADKEQWTTVKKVKGAGSSIHNQFYESFDESPLQGKSYYRIRQTDADGRVHYSEVKWLSWTAAKSMYIPCPPRIRLLCKAANLH